MEGEGEKRREGEAPSLNLTEKELYSNQTTAFPGFLLQVLVLAETLKKPQV